MVLLFGANFPETRLVKAYFWDDQRALESFYGIGPSVSQRLMARFHIHPNARLGVLANRQVLDLSAELSGMTLENDLRRSMQDNIKRLRDMGTYRGRRHAMGLPVRGQNTRTQVDTYCSASEPRGKKGLRSYPNLMAKASSLPPQLGRELSRDRS
ncbi:MAG: hypothetical protein M1812_000537 [Candelaria pacifica]|nr:MAG: hypothetical protein M1812_000537 [Candelaria pacifica]